MAEKKRNRTTDFLVYLVVRLFICVIQALSFETACRVGRFVAWLAYHIDRRHRLVAADNLRQAFPDQYTAEQIDALVRKVYEHFGTMVIEIMHMPRQLHLHNYRKHVEIKEPERLAKAVLSGRPVLFVTGHFGNWEMTGYTLGLFGLPLHAIARPIDNPYIDDFVRKFRQRTGQKLLAKRGDFDNIVGVLAAGGILGTLADQDAGQRGLFVDFFGRPASTHKAVALLAIEHKVVMVVGGTPRIDGKYHLIPVDVIFPEEYENLSDPIRELTQRFTSDLEKLIRMAPEQYFWVHRRWKHQPRERKKKAA